MGEEGDEPIEEMIEYYNELWEKYPHLKLVPGLVKKEFNQYSSKREVDEEIEKVERLGTKPLREKMHETMWKFLVFTTARLSRFVTPLLDPEPTYEDPDPKSITVALTTPDMIKQADPVMEELVEMVPILGYLGDIGDPKVQLIFSVTMATLAVYRENERRYSAPPPL